MKIETAGRKLEIVLSDFGDKGRELTESFQSFWNRHHAAQASAQAAAAKDPGGDDVVA
ncbi:MAG: hypothetical protein HYV07_23525 [Deltaproteobacteria bacterium]|nr:hypothetical protein [Deltaproteobacteria bacterium]